MTQAWYDIQMRGGRLESIARQMNTIIRKYINPKLPDYNPELALPYLDRLLKIESVLQPYVEQMTGIKKVIKAGQPIEAVITR